MTGTPLVSRTVNAAALYVLVAAVLQLVADALLWVTSDYVTKSSLGSTLLLPLGVVTHPLDPVAAYGANADALRVPMYSLLLVGIGLFTWVTLMRHGYANPMYIGKSKHELPLAVQLTPRLKDVGIWVRHDAAEGATQASTRDRVLFAVLHALRPAKDVKQLLVRRSNGMFVPKDAEQPDARVFLGVYRHLHVFRKRKYNVYARPGQHVAVFGPSGAGKGVTQMNPSLLFWNGSPEGSPDGHGKGWPGAVITSTVKSDHVDTALEWRLSLSEQCFVYDPLQSYPEYKDFWVGWSPLSTVETFTDANAVAAALMESEQQQAGGGENAEYFKAQCLMVLGPMILSAALAGRPFKDVYDWALTLETEVTDPNVVSPEGDVAPDSRTYAVMDKLYEYAETTGDSTPLNQMQQVFAKDPREASGVWGTVRKALQPYNDGKSVQSTDPTCMPLLDPRKFYSTPNSTLFIIAPEVANEAKRMRPVFAAFITWLIEEAQKLSRERNGKLPYPALANLDEVKNVGAIPGLAHTLSLTRSIGFFVKHAWQDEAQIESAYGKDDAKTITSNSRTWVILPGISDPDHLERLARLIGERQVKGGRRNKDDDSAQVKAATASMIKEVKDDEILIVTDNIPPFVIKASRYYEDPVMNARYKMGDRRRATGQVPDPNALRTGRAVHLEDNSREIPTLSTLAVQATGPEPQLPRLGVSSVASTTDKAWWETDEGNDTYSSPTLPSLGGPSFDVPDSRRNLRTPEPETAWQTPDPDLAVPPTWQTPDPDLAVPPTWQTPEPDLVLPPTWQTPDPDLVLPPTRQARAEASQGAVPSVQAPPAPWPGQEEALDARTPNPSSLPDERLWRDSHDATARPASATPSVSERPDSPAPDLSVPEPLVAPMPTSERFAEWGTDQPIVPTKETWAPADQPPDIDLSSLFSDEAAETAAALPPLAAIPGEWEAFVQGSAQTAVVEGRCHECGQDFASDGLDADQVRLILERHRFLMHQAGFGRGRGEAAPAPDVT